MIYEELDDETRRWMRVEFLSEESRLPYRSPSLSLVGRTAFPRLMEIAIVRGTEESLAKNLNDPAVWAEFEPSPRGGVRKTDPVKAARTLAKDEFNTWYVRGLCRRLLEEGEKYCQIYRGEDGETEGDKCDAYENKVLEVRLIYNGHRAKYWPAADPKAFSIPSASGCKHTIRRLPADLKAMLRLEDARFDAVFGKNLI